MNNYEDWSHLVAKNLQGEADLFAAIEKDELDDTAAKQAFIHAVLDPFLPENYAIGSGRVVDAFGNYSDHLDIVVYNRDFPRIGLRGTHSVYLFESVLAAFVVKAKFIRKTFFDALDSSASLAALSANIDKEILRKLANKNGMALDQNNEYVHTDPMRTARFKMIGRPPTFVFGFSGIKYSHRQLEENINLWIDYRYNEGLNAEMKSFPSVIATQGCFAWRNAAPLALSSREIMGLGTDDAPIRLVILQLLHLMNRRLNVHSDGYGLKPNLKTYLRQFALPEFVSGVGSVVPRKPGQLPIEAAEKKVAEKAPGKLAEKAPEKAGKTAGDFPQGKFSQSAPIPQAPKAPEETAEPEAKAAKPADDFPQGKFGQSAPIPQAPKAPEATAEPKAKAAKPAADFPSGKFSQSAPIPMAPSADEAQQEDASSTPDISVVPPKPPLDIPLFASDPLPDKEEPETSEFEQTTVLADSPSNGRDKSFKEGELSNSSTDAFIARVKQQMSAPDPFPQFQPEKEPEPDPFSSTVPQ